MSIDFDSAALQTQHDEEEYDQEDYAREQELQKLLTDLPDDMLEDSRDSSPELERSTCSNKNTGSSPPSQWTQQWPVKPRLTSHQVYEADYDRHSPHEYAYGDERPRLNGHHPLSQAFSQPPQDNCYASYGSIDAERSMESSDFSAAEYAVKRHPEAANNAGIFNGGRHADNQTYGNHVQDSEDRALDQYKATYSPRHHDLQPNMYNSHAMHQEGHMDQLQREFLDSTQQTADREQLAQLQILHKALQRQIEDLERKLEDSRRNMRFVEHQFAIVKDEKEGLAVSLKESSRVIEEAKDREAQMHNKLKALEQQVKVLTERDHENLKKQRVAEAAVDSMKQQVVDLCRSDTLSRVRQQHDRDLTVIKEQHDKALLTLQQKLDSTAQALDEQVDVDRRLREQVKQLEQKWEEEQLERARVVNGLTQRLEESQQQCAKLLESNSVQETAQMQIKLQQAQSAKALCENMNKVLQEDLADLKEQITMYESAVKHSVIGLDLSEEWENQLSDSCVDLGLKKSNRKNGLLHSHALTRLSDSKPSRDDTLRQLQAEMQRCLGSLKGKRQKISQLQEELQLSQGRVNELQGQLDEAKLGTQVREMSQVKHLDATGESQRDIQKLREENGVLQDKVEALEKKNKEIKQSEDKLRSTNSELCTKMREMIEELDQEKQEASARTERINQQYRDDVVNWLRVELRQEHEAHVEQLTTEHQQQLLQLQTQLSEANDKMLAVQECYISVCKEKDMLEQREQSRGEEEEAQIKENEKTMKEENAAALQKLRAELELGHQVAVKQLKDAWSRDKDAEIKQQVESRVALERAAWEEERRQTEQTWELRLEEARRGRQGEMVEAACQGDESVSSSGGSRLMITTEELASRLTAQKQQLQLEAERLRQKAVEESRKHIQRELHKKHLEDMAKQVEGAVTRAYGRWIEDLTSLPEYEASLRTEREKWLELQEKATEQRVCEALKEAKKQSSSSRREEEELQQEVADLQTQLEQMRREQAALLKAELGAARAAWNRDKQQELAAVQHRSEQAYQGKLQEQSRKLEQALQQARQDLAMQKEELLLQMEAKLLQRTEERRQQLRGELLAELHAALAQVQGHFLAHESVDEQGSSGGGGGGVVASEGSVTQIIQKTCRDAISRAVCRAKDEWRKASEERLARVLKETQLQQEREIAKMQNSAAQARCRKECGETVGKLQKKNQELQRHLEKACRQLQHSVREHKTALQHLKEEHESSLEKAKEEHRRQQLEGVKRAEEFSGTSAHQQSLQQGLEEMKQQYLTTVEKIRGDMLRYLQESRERAAEMIRTEVQRERQDTARKMRCYYLTCLQELLEDGGKSTGAEKKIMSAASKLAAMAKVLETPVKSKPAKNFNDCPPGRLGPAAPVLNGKISASPASLEQNPGATSRTSAPTNRDGPAAPAAAAAPPATVSLTHRRPHKPPPSLVGCVQAPHRRKTADRSQPAPDQQNKASLLLQEAPVRDERRSNWSVSSSDSEPGLHVPRLSWSERKLEPLKPFSTSVSQRGDFGGLTPDVSDVTVYKDLATKTPRGKTSPHRQPTPGSEAGGQRGVGSGPLFSELRQRQQDSGFDSPFGQQN